MRNLKIAGAVFAGLLILLIGALIALPSLVRGPIAARLQAELDRQAGATVRFDDVQVALLRSFPHLTVTVDGLTVTNHAPFEGVELAKIGRAEATVDVWSVLGGGAIDLRSVALIDPVVRLVVDEEGRWNTDLGGDAPADDAEAASYALSLRHYAVENLTLTYDDRQSGRLVTVEDLDHQGKGDLTSAVVDLQTRTDIARLTVVDGAVTWLRDVRVGWDLAAQLEQESGRITLRDNRLALNDLALAATGTIAPSGDDWDLDLSFEALQTSFKSLLSLVPAAYTDSFADVDASGTLALDGTVKGLLPADGDALPAFVVNLAVGDGRFRYPDLPVGVDQVQVEAKVRHSGGSPDGVEIDVPRFRMRIDDQAVQGRLALRHLRSDPDVDAKVKGTVDLGKLGQALPSDGRRYGGRVDVDVDVAGRVSAFEAQQVDRVRAVGTVKVADLTIDDDELAQPIVVQRMLATLDPKRIAVTDLSVKAGESDLSGSAHLDNLLSWMMTGDTLVGRADIRSKVLDLDALYGVDGDSAEADSSLYVVPDDLDLDVKARFDRLTYGGKTYREVQGRVRADDGALHMDQVRMKMLDGQVVLDGSYRAETPSFADLDVRVDVRDLGLAGALDAFEALRRIAPVAIGSPGRFNSAVSMKLRLGPDLTPDLGSLFSDGRLELFGVTLRPEVMRKAADTLKAAKIANLDLGNSALSFQIANGRLDVKPTSLSLGGTRGTLSGSTGTLDQTLDLRVDFALPVNAVAGDLLQGVQLGKGGTVDVAVLVGGTFTKPTVRTDLGKVAGAVKDQVVDAVKDAAKEKVQEVASHLIDEARKKGDALIAAAEAQSANLVAEAKKKADALRKAADTEADKLLANANNPIKKAAAKEAGKVLRQEADKAAKKVVQEADKAGSTLVSQARTQRDALIAEAEAQARLR